MATKERPRNRVGAAGVDRVRAGATEDALSTAEGAGVAGRGAGVSKQQGSKDAEEQAVFDGFLLASGVKVEPGSIQKCERPDFLCQLAGGGDYGFELLRLVDEDLAEAVGVTLALERRAKGMVWDLPPSISAQLRRWHADSLIGVSYGPADTRDKFRLLRPVMLWVHGLGAEAQGEYRDEALGDLSPSVRFVNVSKITDMDDGPEFSFPQTTWFGGPVHEGTPGKFRSSYSLPNAVGIPVDMIAYYDHLQPPMPQWQPELRIYLEEALRRSVFERVWVYDHRCGEVLQRVP